jgi:hypothetical protein
MIMYRSRQQQDFSHPLHPHASYLGEFMIRMSFRELLQYLSDYCTLHLSHRCYIPIFKTLVFLGAISWHLRQCFMSFISNASHFRT